MLENEPGIAIIYSATNEVIDYARDKFRKIISV